MRKTVQQRFWEKVEKTDSCWLWHGAQHELGYGRFNVGNRKVVAAHRFSYEEVVGPIPPGQHLDHQVTCPKNCVNPDHLRPVTRKQNQENRKGAAAHSKTGIRGVGITTYGSYYVVVIHNGQKHWGGVYTDLSEAGEAAAKLRNRLFTHNDLDRV